VDQNREKIGRIFNAVTEGVVKGAEKFESMLPLLEELQSWGPDAEGRVFSFNMIQNRCDVDLLLLGRYAAQGDFSAPHILAGLNPKNARSSFVVVQMVLDPRKTDDLILTEIADEWKKGSSLPVWGVGPAESPDGPVLDFVKRSMSNHPRYQEAVQAGIKRACGGAAAKAAASTFPVQDR